MNNSPSWIVKCHLTADAHVSAVGTEIAVVGCFSGGGEPERAREPLAGPSLSPDGEPPGPRGWAQGRRGQEAGDGSPCVLAVCGCESSSHLG